MKNFTIRLDDTTIEQLDAIKGEKSRTGYINDMVIDTINERQKKDSRILKEIGEVFAMLKISNLPEMSANISEILLRLSDRPTATAPDFEPMSKKRVPNIVILKFIRYFSTTLSNLLKTQNRDTAILNDYIYIKTDEKEDMKAEGYDDLRKEYIQILDKLIKQTGELFQDPENAVITNKQETIIKNPELFPALDKINSLSILAMKIIKGYNLTLNEDALNFLKKNF